MQTQIKMAAMAALLCCAVTTKAQDNDRKELFDFGWRFAAGEQAGAAEARYDDSRWQAVELPHDWSIALPPDAQAPAGNDGGYYPTGIGWYRKSFTLPPRSEGERSGLYFEGVYMNSTVYVNGDSVGGHPYGYSSFFCDITPHLRHDAPNVVAVRVDNSAQKNCRWYSGSGIYRHVWLTATPQLHFARQGVGITTPQVSRSAATVKIEAIVENETEQSRSVTLQASLRRNGQTVATGSRTLKIAAGKEERVLIEATVNNPQLWSPDSPALYQAQMALIEEGDRVWETIDRTFGIRSIEYSADGLLLNGEKITLNGGCLHHDNGCLGAASFDDAEERKVRLMKEAGFNAARTSHNPPSPAFLDACDRLGLLVIDEAFDGWRDSKTPHDYSTLFDRWWRHDVQSMVLRDRNHPCIFCWSTGNEVIERKKIEVVTTAKNLADAIHAVDPTRPVTSALAAWDDDWEIYDPLAAQHGIVGYNYMIHKAESDHRRLPERVMMQTESYPRDAFANWERVNDCDYIVGDFVWTAIDYLGESGIGRYYYDGESEGEHYHRDQFPWHGAYCGDIDLTGWRKPISHYRSILHGLGGEKLHLAVKEPDGYYGPIKETMWSVWPTWESWTWPGHEGKRIEVEISSRYPRVRLYLNDSLVGEADMGRANRYKATIALPYTPGILRAEAMEGDRVAETRTLQTAGPAARLRLTADRSAMRGDGQSLAYVTVEVVDRNGTPLPQAELPLTLKVQGAATLAAACSADLKCRDAYSDPACTTWKGRALIVLRSRHQKSGRAKLTVSAPGLPAAQIAIGVQR